MCAPIQLADQARLHTYERERERERERKIERQKEKEFEKEKKRAIVSKPMCVVKQG